MEALKLYTAENGWFLKEEATLGTIEPGKLADLVVLSDDIMTIDEERIRDAKVLATLLGGKPVHDSGLFN
jgi:predicted amidohydrolase YtcJ